jgi:hypothetical protein
MIVLLETLALVIFGAWSIQDGYRIQHTVRRPGMFDAIGPDRYIMVLGALLIGLGIAYGLSSRAALATATPGESPQTARAPALQRITVALVLAFALYVLIVPVTGYLLATLVFFCASYWTMGVRSIRSLAAAAVLSAAAYAVIFIGLSDMPLPRGMLGSPY